MIYVVNGNLRLKNLFLITECFDNWIDYNRVCMYYCFISEIFANFQVGLFKNCCLPNLGWLFMNLRVCGWPLLHLARGSDFGAMMYGKFCFVCWISHMFRFSYYMKTKDNFSLIRKHFDISEHPEPLETVALNYQYSHKSN